MRTDDTYNRPIIITLGKELQWRLKVRWKVCVNRSRSGIRASRARDASLETIGETIEGDKNNFIDEKLARGEKGLFIKLSFSLGKILTRYII